MERFAKRGAVSILQTRCGFLPESEAREDRARVEERKNPGRAERERRISRRGRMVIIAWRQTGGGVPMLRTRCVSLLPILSRGRRKNRDGSRSSSRTTYSFPLTLSLPLLSRAREKCSRKIVRILPLEFPSPDGMILTHL